MQKNVLWSVWVEGEVRQALNESMKSPWPF